MMTRPVFLIVMIAIAAIALMGMWLAWRARTRRGAGATDAGTPLVGEAIAAFPRVSYVSTTPAGSPFERLAIPGLTYKGYAAVTVRSDGVEIAVTGETPVRISRDLLSGTDVARGRIGKVVDRDGLLLLRWRLGPQGARATGASDVESSFRFRDPSEQLGFADAIDQISPTPSTSQEGAK